MLIGLNNKHMCSFDANSLVTNVPLDETINISIDKLFRNPNPPNLPKEVMRALLEFVTKQSHFIFDGKYYDQIDGGNGLAPRTYPVEYLHMLLRRTVYKHV